jgi:hypothetical protein
MPDKEETMVDIDTSAPDQEVEITSEDTSTEETEIPVSEDTSASTLDASDEKLEVKTEEKEEVKTEEKKDELEIYSKDVQRRIAKLTKKWREAERQKDEAINYARVQKDTADKLGRKYSSLETNSLKDREAKLAAAIEGAKARLAHARNEGDTNLEVDIQRDISRLGYEEARLLEQKSAREELSAGTTIPTMDNVNIPRQPVSDTAGPDPKAEHWGSKNRWFGTDKPMTYTAFDLHETLINEEGYDPSSDEYYSELDKRIRVAFPTKFANNAGTESTKPTQVVASARRSVKTGRKKTVTLTSSQVAIARKLGVPLEEYAKQLNITEGV